MRIVSNRSKPSWMPVNVTASRRWIFYVSLTSCALSSCEMFSGEFVLNQTADGDDSSEADGPDAAPSPSAPDAAGSPSPQDSGLDNACAPFPAHRCVEGVLQECARDEFGERVYSDQEDCGEQARCSSSEARCLACSPGSFRCSGEQLEHCDGSQWKQEEDCAASELRCDAELGDCTVCLLNDDARCAGSDALSTCVQGPQGREWVSSSCGGFPCRTREAGADYCQQCDSPGDSHCITRGSDGSSTLLATCGADFSYRTIPCADGFVCEESADSSARCVE